MNIMTERNFYQAVAHRRTNYALGRNIPVAEDTIIDTVEKVTREVPSAFNMQSGRVIVALGKYHDKVWDIVMETLRKIVPAEKFAPTEAKVKGFAAAYGTLLYFEETDTVKKLQEQFPGYAANFPVWASQGNGMLQFALWTALTDLGLGVNIQALQPDHRRCHQGGLPGAGQLDPGGPDALRGTHRRSQTYRETGCEGTGVGEEIRAA